MSDQILIRGVNWLGDAVMTMPAIAALKSARPDAHIALLVKPWVAPIFEGDPNINEIILYEDHHNGVFGKLRLAHKLRGMGFKTALLLQNAFDAAVLAFLAGIPERIGYNRDSRGWMLTNAVEAEGLDRKLHHIDYYLELLWRSGLVNRVAKEKVEAQRPEPWIYLTLDERLAARKQLEGLARPIIGINPGAKFGSAKIWLPERFAAVASWVIRELKGSVIIFGGPGEGEAAIEEKIISHMDESVRGSVLRMAGKTSLRQLSALIAESDALISNDSGPMHVGYGVKTPLVAIFGSTSPELTGPPLSNANSVLRSQLPCVPCFKRTCPESDLKCMEAISVDTVTHALRKVIPTNRAVFFDRDGTLCEDADYLSSWYKLKVFDEINALKQLSDQGFMLIGISNQSGIERGIVPEEFVRDLHAMFIEKHGFQAFYHCPHHPDKRCTCRKPEPGMLYLARAEHNIDLRKSYVLGDKDADMLLAKVTGATGILVRTGKQERSDYADYTAKGLLEAARTILLREEKINSGSVL